MSICQHFENLPFKRTNHRASQSLLRREYIGRRRKQIQTGGGLESVGISGQENLFKVGSGRRGSYGYHQVQKMSNVLLLEQDGHRSMGDRQPGNGCELAAVQPSLLFPSFSSPQPSSGQGEGATSTTVAAGCTVVAWQAILPHSTEHDLGLPEDPCQQLPCDRHSDWSASPSHGAAQASRLSDFWQIRQENSALSRSAQKLVQSSWRNTTESRYGGSWAEWVRWCASSDVQSTSPSLNNVLDFLASLFDRNLSYRTINVYRSALSGTLRPIDGYEVGKHPLVCRLLKGVFNERPPLQKLCPTWSVFKVMDLLKGWSPSSDLDLKCLTLKTVMLLALASAKRCSSLALLSTREGFFELSESKVRLQPVGLEKKSGPDHIAPPIVIEAFMEDPRLCPVHYLKAYIRRTASVRKSDLLFVTMIAPHTGASTATISSWIEKVISQSGQSGSGGSVRSVSTTRAVSRGVPIQTVLEAADWARVSTFRRFYFKPAPLSFVDSVLH